MSLEKPNAIDAAFTVIGFLSHKFSAAFTAGVAVVVNSEGASAAITGQALALGANAEVFKAIGFRAFQATFSLSEH
ncbi:hypothetical protein AMR42_14550 [Limnothrix sp. PR1529]|nr:hypothetical protein BCR12_02270 [Limnothrix sp. P13C2]PIB07077.1 hypothetical protein AMR42_14550 [Limnothrix sp. PR1529]